MKIGVLSDIHGNLPALEAVHAALRLEAPDLILNLGDCVSGPLWPEKTAKYLREQKWPTVRGNHDRIVSWPDQTLGKTDKWAKPHLSEDSIEWLRDLPPTWATPEGDVLACHGTPGSDALFLLDRDDHEQFYVKSDADIRDSLGLASAPLILCGHSHTPRCIRVSTGQMIVNPGSVGIQAFPSITATGSPHARFAVLTRTAQGWNCDLRAIEYDWDRAARKAAKLSADWAHCIATGFKPPAE